jgi:predicted nucleic acid-binding protein
VIVLDASAVVELLLDTAAGRRIATVIDDPVLALHAPHLLDVEVCSVLRRYAREGAIDSAEAQAAIEDLVALDIYRHAHEPLLERAWALRDNITAYDAMYVTLAEALDAALLTRDAKLARVAAKYVRAELVR